MSNRIFHTPSSSPARRGLTLAALLVLAFGHPAPAHDLGTGSEHPHYRIASQPPLQPGTRWLVAQTAPPPVLTGRRNATNSPGQPPQAIPFAAFAPHVQTHWDQDYLYVEDNGLPTHPLMVGITAWQQQLPLPQPYFGGNAWRLPLHPIPAAAPRSIRNQFLRGAIAIAVNGIPIFNPQNNRGELSLEIGELDEYGGHCGRADDYHYHAAPLHLQKIVGQALPIAFALDGYPIHGLTEPDGSSPSQLDSFQGHTTPQLGYHYHAATKYPYVNGGFHGEVVERDGQVDPQPRAQPVRPALTPLRGARITGFTAAPDSQSFDLRYLVNNRTAAIHYTTSGSGDWQFQFRDPDGATRTATYRTGEARGLRRGALGPESPAPGERTGAADRDQQTARAPVAPAPAPDILSKTNGTLRLLSPVVANGGPLPVDFTGDGSSATLPLSWTGAPTGTRSYVLIMHHVDPAGVIKWYWTLYNIPAAVHELPRNTTGIGTLGNNSVNDRIGYAPPHSKGPGPKTYILTLYALSAPLDITVNPARVNRAVLLAVMKDLVLEQAELRVIYDRKATAPGR